MDRTRLFHPEEKIPRDGYFIHLMEPAQLQDVIDLEGRSFDNPWSADLVAREVQQEHASIVVITEGGAVLGFVILWVILDEIHILNVAVEPALRRKGLAKLLLDELLDRGRQRGLSSAILEVRVSNEAAIGLYRSLGFDMVGKRRAYYSDGEDAWLMQRDL